MSIKTALLDIVKKVVKWDKKLEIYTNGDDNAYPERIERLKNNSITAKMSSDIMVQYLIGKGFGELDNAKIGGVKLIDLADDIARDLVDNKGVFIHVNYNANFVVSNWSVIPFNECRVGKKDSQEYNGKILVSKDWNDIKKNPATPINVYNNSIDVVKYQMGVTDTDSIDEIANKVAKYKGQILYINLDSQYYYPLARIDAVQLDCRSEYLASVYKNEILERGFFGKTLVVTRPLIDNQLIKDAQISQDANLLRQVRDAESERENFKETIKDFVGAGGSGGVLHMEVDFKGENLNDAILFKNIESNIDDKLFQFTEDSSMSKILMAYNNLPVALVKASESLFGNSGEALRVAKETYWENTSKDRNKLETLVNDLLRVTDGIAYTEYVRILPLLTPKIKQDATN